MKILNVSVNPVDMNQKNLFYQNYRDIKEI